MLEKSDENERVKTIWEETGKTIRLFAEDLGVSHSFLARIIKGKVKVSKSVALKIEQFWGIRSEWILKGEGPREVEFTKDKTDPFDKMVLESLAEWQDESDQTEILGIIFLYKYRAREKVYESSYRFDKTNMSERSKWVAKTATYNEYKVERNNLLNEIRTILSREEFIYTLLYIHFKGDVDYIKRCHWLKNFDFRKGTPQKVLEYAKSFNDIQDQIDPIWKIEK